MPSIRLTTFDGMKPAVNTLNSRNQQAQMAHNVIVRDTTIRPFNSPEIQASERHFGDPAMVRDLYRLADNNECCGYPVTFERATSVIEPVDPGDCPGFTGVIMFPCNCEDPYRYFPCEDEDGASGVYPLVVPQPQRTLVATLTNAGTLMNDPQGYHGPDQRSYTYTWVDRFGVESPPAIPTATFPSHDDQEFTLTNFDAAPAHAVCLRIYRITPTFEADGADTPQFDTDFHLVEEVDLTVPFNGTFVDDVRTCDMPFGVLTTDDNCPPPCMDQVVLSESGHAVGFRGNQLHISERHEPHNFPEKFRIEIPERIVGIVAFYDWIMVGTTGRPYRVQLTTTQAGNEADTSIEALPYTENLPCLTRYAMVATSFGALYPSHKGLVALAPQGSATVVSRDRIDEDDWINWMPNVAAWHNGKYYASRSPVGISYILDITDASEGPLDVGDLVTIDWQPDMAHSGRDGRLWFIEGGDLFTWHEGNQPMQYLYRSKEFRSAGLMAFNVAKVVGSFGQPVELTIFCDGSVYDKITVENEHPFRLVRAGRGLRWSFQIEGTIPVNEVHIATSRTELTESTGG